jgi:hypothetical protein
MLWWLAPSKSAVANEILTKLEKRSFIGLLNTCSVMPMQRQHEFQYSQHL